jgi:hypothetical protein
MGPPSTAHYRRVVDEGPEPQVSSGASKQS